MPKIIQMLKERKRRKGRLRRGSGLPIEAADTNIVQFPQVMDEIHEEYPDYEVISRWLKLADEMLGSADQPHVDYAERNSRKKA